MLEIDLLSLSSFKMPAIVGYQTRLPRSQEIRMPTAHYVPETETALTFARSKPLWQELLPVTAIFAVSCGVFFGALGDFPLFNPDEALYAEPAREMLETGEYITTLLNYVWRFTKPPLAIWAMAGSMQVFGVNEFAARFFGAACGAVLVACTYCFASRFTNARTALIASAALTAAPLFVGTGRESIVDMPLTLFVAGSLMCFYRAFNERDSFFKWLAYVLVGLAVMTKGPVGAVLPVAIVAAFHVLRGTFKQCLGVLQPLTGSVIVGAIALPWFVAEIIITKGAYFQEFIVRENFQRFTTVVDAHKGPWYYHILAMFGGFFPWSVFLPQAAGRALEPVIAAWSRRSGPSAREVGEHLQRRQTLIDRIGQVVLRIRNLNARQELMLFLLLWTVAVVAFFSASVSKLLPYTLPAFPAIAILIAMEIDACITEKARLRLMIPFAVIATAYGVLLGIGPFILGKLRDAPAQLKDIALAGVVLESALTVVTLILLSLRRSVAAISVFASATILLLAGIGSQVLPILSQKWEGALPDFSRYAGACNDPIYVFDIRKPGVPFYTHRKVIQPAHWALMVEMLQKDAQAYILSKVSNEKHFLKLPGCKVMARDGSFILVRWQQNLL